MATVSVKRSIVACWRRAAEIKIRNNILRHNMVEKITRFWLAESSAVYV